MIETTAPKKLDNQFQQPKNWRWQYLDRQSHQIRYGYAAPDAAENNGTIVILPGLSEFCEKYFETTNEALAKNYAVIVIDWRGQGGSTRYLDNSHKRHSQGFAQDAQDLHAVLQDCPATQNQPDLYMLAHSMGSNIGMQLALKHPNLFKAAMLSAPLMGLHIFERTPDIAAALITKLTAKIASRSYAPFGGDWTPAARDLASQTIFSTDPLRSKVHNAWMIENPSLQVGHITYQWLRDAYQACKHVRKSIKQGALKTPCLIATAGHENFVSNTAIKSVLSSAPDIQHFHLPDARHEIMMETQESREKFIDSFYSFIKQIAIR